MRRRRALVQVGLILATALVALAPSRATAPSASGPPIGRAAPDFALPDLGGHLVTLKSERGKIVVLNFWAFWCDTWRAEMPYLQDLSRQESDLDFQIIAVSVDGQRLSEYRRRAGNTARFPVLLDSGSSVSRAYRIGRVPTVVVVDRAGIVRYEASGYPGNHVLLDVIRRLRSGFAVGGESGS